MLRDEGHILDMWTEVMVDGVRDDGPDLSARQLALMLMVHRRPGLHTVKRLSIDLNISKPAITRALHALGQAGFVQRTHPDHDRRESHVHLTAAGIAHLAQFADRLERAFHEPV
jgi:DNA-binding MarR family transcriptional regulator